MKRRPYLISEGSGKKILVLALVSLLALPIVGLYKHHRALAAVPKEARMHPEDVKRRAIAVGRMLGESDPIISDPQFVTQRISHQTPKGMRHLWTLDCLVRAHHYNLVFNDVTGNMESMYADGLNVTSKAAAQTPVIVTTPGQAVEGAVQCLKNLQIVTRGSRIALSERPECERDGITWRMVWKVQYPEIAQPCEIRMMLNGSDATPMMVVNCNELSRFVQN